MDLKSLTCAALSLWCQAAPAPAVRHAGTWAIVYDGQVHSATIGGAIKIDVPACADVEVRIDDTTMGFHVLFIEKMNTGKEGLSGEFELTWDDRKPLVGNGSPCNGDDKTPTT
jgi:uncharacterized protein involved in tellurium resistance